MPLSQFILFIPMSLRGIRLGPCCSWGKGCGSPREMLLSPSCPPKPLAGVGWRLGECPRGVVIADVKEPSHSLHPRGLKN